MIEELIRKNRSCRRFYQDHPVDMKTLKALVNLGRLTASAANLQPLKYVLCCNRQKNEAVFSCLGWAGYLKDWPGPDKGEQPSAYIIMLGDTKVCKDFGCDHGIAGQSILLGATEAGLAGCMLASIQQERLRRHFNIAPHLKILLVLAIGKPKEHIALERVDLGGDIRYWRDDNGVHHVPKRCLADIIVNTFA